MYKRLSFRTPFVFFYMTTVFKEGCFSGLGLTTGGQPLTANHQQLIAHRQLSVE